MDNSKSTEMAAACIPTSLSAGIPPTPKVGSKNRARCETVSTADGSSVNGSHHNNTGYKIEEDAAVEVPRWFPRCCGKPILHGKPEALGFLLGMIGQSISFFGVLSFVIPALMYFAKMEAGCEVELQPGETVLAECNETVYGLKPSSLITTLASALSLCVAVMVPLIGALIDYSSHRRRVGRILAFIYCCIVFPQVFLSEETWFPLTILILLMGMNALALSLCLHAYLPDLTDSEEELNDFTKAFAAGPSGTSIVFIIAVMGISVALGVDGEEGPTANIAATMGVVVMSTCFFLAWGLLLQERPALNVRPDGWLLTAGFKEIYHTTGKLYRTNRALLWFFVSVALGDVKPLTGTALTFMSSHQGFDSMDVGIAAVTLLVSVVPGAVLSAFVCRKLNPIQSNVIAMVCFSIVTLCASAFLTGPNQKVQTYVVVACWGVIGGWKVTSTQMLVAAIVPEGNDAELMGFYLFSDVSLSWLPPLIFTAINEAGYSERLGLASIVLFFLLALVAYWKMGSYDDCVKKANRLTVASSDKMVVILEDEDDLSLSMANEMMPTEEPVSILEEPRVNVLETVILENKQNDTEGSASPIETA